MRILIGLVIAALTLVVPSTAAARDRDRDRLPDSWERKHHLSVKRASTNGDPDRDRVDNRNELQEGTKPRSRDSDRDGRPDGLEDRDRDGLTNAGEDLTGNDPRDPDSDGDGLPDGKEAAGVVVSLDAGVLIIELAAGGPLGALVTPDTEVECESENELEAHYAGLSRRKRHGRRAAASVYEEDEYGEDEDVEDEEYDDLLEEDEDYDEEEDDEEEYGEDEKYYDPTCPADALAPGARVRDAEFVLSPDGLELEYIGLLR